MPHTHSNGFLEDLKNQDNTPERFCMLVEKTITCRGEVGEKDKEEIFQKLLKNNNIIQANTDGLEEETTQEENPSKETEHNHEQINLTLKKLIHTSGVNAILSGETIPFSNSCTIIYGLNGQGKSGYFRVLNELAGGSEKCEIKPNIYNDQEDPLNVSIEYTLNDETKTYDYTDKNLRGISPFDNIKVFDHNYMRHFLNDREIQGNIEPLGLHLFEKLTKIIEEFESKIQELKENKQEKIPNLESIKNCINTEDLKSLLEKIEISNDEYQKIQDIQNLTDEEEKNIKELKDKLDKLNKSNKEDILELTKTRKSSLETLKENIEKLEKINDYIEKVETTLTKYNQALYERDTKKRELSILQKIPGNETKEWQSFIESGQKYGEKAKEHEHNPEEKCIYCQQPLLDDSLDIIKAYGTYLSDTSQTKVETEKQNIDVIKEDIGKIIINFTMPDFLEQKETKTIKTIKAEAIQLKNKLIKSIEKNNIDKGLKKIEIEDATTNIENKTTQYQKDIQDFNQNKTTQETQIKDIEKKIHKLEDQKTVYTNKKEIKKYFCLHKEIKELEKLTFSSFKTRISRKSSEATEKLITQDLIDKFNETLPKIRSDLDNIELRKAQTTGGIPHIKLCIKNKTENVDAILSEGEQKAVCLALFFAEILSEGNKVPIIFDDPVTNLDYFIKDGFSNLIGEISTTNQVIIFTHDLIFSKMIHSSLEGKDLLSCHYIEKISTGSGKVNQNTTPKMGDSNYSFKEAEQSIKSIQDGDSLQEKQKSISYAFNELRKATEYLIEEKLFAKSITRFDDHVKVQNLLEVSFDDEIINKIVELHANISEKGDMHGKSDTILQNSQRSTDFDKYKKEFEEVKKYLEDSLKKKRKEREENKKKEKQKVSF